MSSQEVIATAPNTPVVVEAIPVKPATNVLYCLKCKTRQPIDGLTVVPCEFKSKKKGIPMTRWCLRGVCSVCKKNFRQWTKHVKPADK